MNLRRTAGRQAGGAGGGPECILLPEAVYEDRSGLTVDILTIFRLYLDFSDSKIGNDDQWKFMIFPFC